MIAREKALEVIDSAIKDYAGETGSGRWVARFWHTGHGPFPALVYEYVVPKGTFQAHVYKDVVPIIGGKSLCKTLPGQEWRDVSDPWLKWGGSSIVEEVKKRCKDFYAGRHDADFRPWASIYESATLFFMGDKDKMKESLNIIDDAIADYNLRHGCRNLWRADAIYFNGELKPALVYTYFIDEEKDKDRWVEFDPWESLGGHEIASAIEKTGKLMSCGRDLYMSRNYPRKITCHEVAIFTTTE
jgi:hypothetical protein